MSEAPTQGPPGITFAERCDRGTVREENQDSVLHARIPLGELLIVADGIGGYKGGAVASRMVVDAVYSLLAALTPGFPADKAIREAASRANADILAAANAPGSPYSRMGSTVVLALIQNTGTIAGTDVWIGHIGDSRAYLGRGGKLSRLTSDHSAVQALIDRNLITPEQALTHPDASVLTRSLGHVAKVEIDIDKFALTAGDTLLLCSDGLWGYAPEREIERIATDAAISLDAAAQSLLDLAITVGGHDNIGIQMARLVPPLPGTPPLPPPPPRKRLIELLALALCVIAAAGAAILYLLLHHHPHRFHG